MARQGGTSAAQYLPGFNKQAKSKQHSLDLSVRSTVVWQLLAFTWRWMQQRFHALSFSLRLMFACISWSEMHPEEGVVRLISVLRDHLHVTGQSSVDAFPRPWRTPLGLSVTKSMLQVCSLFPTIFNAKRFRWLVRAVQDQSQLSVNWRWKRRRWLDVVSSWGLSATKVAKRKATKSRQSVLNSTHRTVYQSRGTLGWWRRFETTRDICLLETLASANRQSTIDMLECVT